ncbi:unnamed protein product [Didymodactylos carnosus]|uniref:Uncharacterized protein n=1 Tax=Didymodactylos carnosus TaxID=1234261 RepID=A0A8S2PZH8_9BILA|nr:unnamed protein product [Didymodactylos carnosus]CAF4072937.1 unnamed protein product [Didymodactylos carnosus]
MRRDRSFISVGVCMKKGRGKTTLLKSSNTSVAKASNIPPVQFNVGEQLTSTDEIVHLIVTEGEEEIFVDFDR